MVWNLEDFNREFMSLDEAAQILHIQKKTFYDRRWREARGIILHSFPSGRKKFIRRADIFSQLRAS